MNNNEVKKLYTALINKGYSADNIGTADIFVRKMQDAKSRKDLYRYVQSRNDFRIGSYDNYERRLLGEQPTGASVGNPMQPTQADPQQQPATQSVAQPQGLNKALASARVSLAYNSPLGNTDAMIRQSKQIADSATRTAAVTGTVQRDVQYNPVSNQFEQMYVTPNGAVTPNKALADYETQQFREYRRATDMSLGGQLQRAEDELRELQEQYKKASQNTVRTTSARAFMPAGVRTHDEAVSADNNELNTLWTTIRQKQEQIQMLRNKISADNDADNLWGDTRRFFRHAGQAVFNTDAWDFGLGALGDATTMLKVAEKAQQGTPLTENEQNLLENIYLTQNIQSQYGDLGDAAQYGEMGGQMLSFMKDMALFNVAGGANIGANLTKNLIAGMAKKGTSSLAKRFTSEGTINFIRHNGLRGVRNLILEQGAGRAVSMATTRALGVAAEDLLIKAPVMTATIQAGNLAADIIETKLGPVQYDDNTGQFNFVNDTSWGEAAWEQSADRIIENASEMIGGRWDFFKGFGLDDVERIFGANHVVSRMLRATPETLSTAVNKTSDILSKFGFNGVPGEVAEEYWGQFARTMSGLESAYMPLYDDNGKPIFERDGEGKIVLDEEGNPVQAKQNLFESGEFHKDIWGGIALTAGMMQTASTGMVYGGMALNNAANKKMLNKALRMSDIRANALLTPEIWEPLREALSAMDNEDVIDMTDWIRHDNDFTDKQRDAAMSYIWNLLQQRGSNLMELAEKRNGVFTEYAEEWGNAYNNGYETVEAEQMQDIRNMYDYQRNRLSQLLTPEEIASIDADAANYLSVANIGNKKRDAVLDYVNAKQVYDGMQQRGTDDVDIAIEQSNALIDSHTHQDSNQVQSAIMKEGDRKVYIMKGNVITSEDGTIDVSNSDDSIIVRDAETGEMIQMSPELLLQVDEVQDASEQKALAENEIRTRMDQEFNDKVNGTVYFNAGDVYNIVDDSGNPAQLTVTPNKEGVIDNGDGTVNVTSDGVNVVAMNKETIQEMVDAANIGRIANNEVERTTKLAEQTTQPQPTDVVEPQTAPEPLSVVAPTAPQMPTTFNFGDEITIVDDNGNPVTATITFVNDDGYNLQLPQGSTLGGYNVAVVKPDEIQDVLYNPNAPVTEVVEEQPQDVPEPMQPTAEEIPVAEEQNVAQPTESAPITQVSAMQRIPRDEEGNLLYEQTDPQTAWDAIVEQTNGNATMAQNVVDSMVADKEAALKKVEKIQLPKGISVAEKIVAEQEKANAISQAQNELAFWQSVSQLNNVAETMEEVQPTQEEAVEEQPTEVVEESQPIIEEQSAPVKEYEDRAVDDVWNELLQDNENDVVEAVDTAKQMYNVYKTEYDKVEKHKATGKTVQEINEAKRARKAKLADLQRRMDYWQKVAERGRDLVAEQKRIEEINEATKNFAKYYSQMGEPINFHDYVLRALSGGGIKFRWADSPTGTKGLGSHLGMRSEEERRKRIWLLNNESGLYPEQVAEDLIVGYESETNSRLNIDSMEALDEVLEILRTHSTAKSMYDEVLEIQDEINQRNQREERRRYDEWCYENFGMTAEEYEAYQEVVESELRAKDFTDEEYEACNNIVAEETLNQQTIEENEDTEGNEQGRNDELRTGSDEVLPSEESVSAGGIGETESNGGSEADVDSDSENGAVSESTSGEQVGPFGKIYTQFKGKAKEAIAFLLERRDGEALGALHHPEIGDIDLVWGKEGTGKSDGFGLAKLSKYHPEVLDDLQEILNEMHVTKRSENRIQLESDTHQAAVRLTWDSLRKNWLLTAFEKKNSAFDNTTDTDETFEVGKQNDTATLQNTVFDSKDTNLSEDNKGEAEKVSEEPKNTNKIEDFGEHIRKLPKAERAKAQRAALEELGIFAEVALPKGSKWSDGRKFGQKATRRSASTQITALVVGEDLYIKGIGLPWTNINNKNNDVYVIRNFRKWQSIGDFQMALLDHADITLTPSEEDAVNTIFTENGIGFNRSITRPIEFQQSAEALENNTPAQQLATEAAVAMLENNGIEVVEATDEMVEAVLGQSEAEFMSKRSNERAEINRTIDDAISFVTGKPIKEVRQERIRKERERKELAKEIYENALSGNFNDVILQKINQFIDDATPANPFGRRISQRIPHEMERGLLEGVRTNAVDALFSRISESSVGANERFSESGRRAIESRKKEMLKAWAIATGNWYTDLSAFTDEAEPFAEGTDSKVYLSKDGQFVIKASKGKPYGKRFRPDIDNLVLFNNVFRNSRYEIVGYGEIDGQFVRILKQPIVDFSNSTPLTEDERVEYMRSLGFTPLNKEKSAFTNGKIIAADLQKNNIIRDNAGNVRVIDADMKLHTKDVGGDYEYLPVEYDLPSPQFHIVYHGTGTKFDAFDHSHMGEGEGAQAYGWGTYVTEVEGIGKSYAKQIVGFDKEEEIQRIRRAIKHNPFGRYLNTLPEAEKYFNDLRIEWAEEYNEGYDVKTHIDEIGELVKLWKKLEKRRYIYTVEIPDDNGSNYLDYTNQIKPEQAERINSGLAEIQDRLNGYEQGDAKLMYERSGVQVYHRLSQLLGGDKQASEFLNSIGFVGIKYPAQYTMGGRSDNAKNYVIFNENDAKIVDRVEFMRTPNGTVYGWTIGGKVYLTKSGMNPNTPVHEYTHLWANAMMQKNPKGWQSIKDLLRGTPVWNEVMLDKNYANIHDNEDLVASEVLSRLSGKENAKKLEAMAEQMLKESKGIFAKAEAISLIERMKEALNKFWNWVGTNLFGIDKFDSIEQVTDRVLWDMATGTDLSGVEYSDIVEAHYWSDKTAEKAIAAFKEHFPNAGEVVIFNSPNELYDFGRRLGEPEEDINDYLKRVEDVEVAASYSPDLDKMLIFAWQHANFYQTLFHENVHRAINKLGGIENFMDLAIALKYFDIELFNKLFKYYSQDEIYDEVITYSLEYAFAGNALESLKTVLSEKAIEQLNEILNYIGYETGRDTATEIERFERHPNSKEFEYVRGRTRRLSREFSEKNERRKLAEIYSSNTFQSKTERTLEKGSEAEGAYRELEDLYRSSEEEQAYAERMRGYMRDKVNELAERMNLKIEVVEDASTLKGKKAKAKGFFNPRTGTITIVLPNNSSIADVESTVFHEAVAHYGLRQLFGDKFDEFLDEVYEFAEPEIRERIARMALRNGLDIRKATEEYLATLAEDTKFFESSPAQWEWFAKIKRAFIKMLRTVGLNYMGPRMSDNELRYFLWLSYENLRGKAMPIFKEAAQITKQQELGLDNYGQSIDKTDSVAGSEEVLYRKGETPREKYERVTRRPTINNDVKLYHNLWNRFVEAYQDKMQSLSALQNAVAEESGKPIKPHEDAYSAENRMSSENKAQAEIYKRDFLGPLMNVITSLIKNKKVTYQDIKDYLIAKHGLERNDHMAMRDAMQQALKDLGPKPERPTSYLDADYDAKQQAWEDWNIAYTEAVKTNYEANRQRDYAGLTGLTKSDNVADAEAKAEQIVADFENKCGNQEIIDLWNVVNNATKATLRKQFESGLISKSTYENVQNMYEYYVPLRGWDAETAEDNYDYLLSSSIMLPPVFKTAKGRGSLAEDPIAMIGFMAEAAIIKGNRNLMKQRFLAMARNHETDLLTITEQWYTYDVSTDSWVPSFPQIPADATAEQIAQAITEHEERMEEAEKNGTATKNTQGLKLGMHILKKNAQEHCVRVLQNGKEYCIYVNGNPRAAQALNGLTNPNMNDGKTKRFVESLKNGMAQLLTSKNPAFVITNLSRDILWAGTSVMIKEGAKYVAQYTKNISKALTTASIPRLLKKFNDGTLDESIPEERMFAEFIRNGGETGFTQINTVENYKRDIKRMIKDSQSGPVNPRKVWNAVWDGVEFLNRSAEDTTRFMVYMTSRQMGRTVAESINDAKEITVNFNRKGSGGMGARLMSFAYIFFNAAVQSLANFGKLLKNHPAKTTAALLTFASAGLIAPTLNLAMQAMFGGDDDDTNYWDLPEWVRRNNIVLWFPFSDNGYLTIPLPHELRPFYGMGEIAMSIIYGKENVEDGLAKATQSFASLLPLDFTGNGGNLYVTLAPSVLQPIEQVHQNVDFFGVPIYKKNAWNEGDPEYTKAYSGTSTWLVDATRWLNDFTREKGQEMSGDIDLNPAIIEHLFEAYTGGVGKTINRTAKTIAMIWDEDMQEVRNVPVLSSFYRTVDNKSANSQVNREYFEAIDEMKNTQATERQFKKNKEAGILGYAKELTMLQNSDLYKRYEKIKEANKDVNKWQEKLKTANPQDAEDIENRILQIKVDMLEELERIENKDVRK